MSGLIAVDSENDIPKNLSSTPVGDLLRFHNLGAELPAKSETKMVIGTCMDRRIELKIPPEFAYVIREAGANLRQSDFPVAFAVSMAKIRHVAVIAHTDCAMRDVAGKKDAMIAGLTDLGLRQDRAEAIFENNVSRFDFADENIFALLEASRFKEMLPGISVTPLIYKVEDHRLYLIDGE